MLDAAYVRCASCVHWGSITRSPSKYGSWLSTVRLKGAYFSRAIRSQLSSTASKVSRECSAKRLRLVSVGTCSHWYSRKSMAGRRLMVLQHLEDAGSAHAAAYAHGHAPAGRG